jgi:hypothetical protein
LNADDYSALLHRLGFTLIGRGRRLQHPASPPAVYFNSQRGAVFFSVLRKDRERFDPALWTTLPRQQQDKLRQRLTVQPVAGKEQQALRSLLGESLDLRELQDAAEQRRIERRAGLAATERQQLLQARRGQGIYRANLEAIEQRCRVTGLQDRRHLRATHIKSWSQSDDREKLDGCNGLLLSPHLQHLFERGHISFSDAGDVLVSHQLNPAVLKSWGLAPHTNVGSFRPGQCVYLAWHRAQVFEQQEGGRREPLKP